ARNLAQVEDEVVFLQPFGGIGFQERWSGPLQLLFDDAGGKAFEVRIPNPAAGKLNELVPIAGKRQFEDHADDAVVEVLDLALQTLAALKNQRLQSFFNRRTLEPDISRSHMFEAGIDGARPKNTAKLIEANLFTDVKLDQNQDRTAQWRLGRLRRHESRQSLGGYFADHRRD